MDSNENNKSLALKLKNNLKWRRFKVLYLAVCVTIILVIFFIILAVNQQQTCDTSTSYNHVPDLSMGGWKDEPDVSSSCQSIGESGGGISISILLIPIVIALIGYINLPKMFVYLNPTKSDSVNDQHIGSTKK